MLLLVLPTNLTLAILDITRTNINGSNQELLEMAIEIQKLAQTWIKRKNKMMTPTKSESQPNLEHNKKTVKNAIAQHKEMSKKKTVTTKKKEMQPMKLK